MIIITEDKINELRIISNSATKLDMTPFVIYNGNVYLFNSTDSMIFIQEVTNFAYELYEKRVANVAMPDDYQDCWDLFEFDLSNSIKTIAGYFSVADGKTIANFYAKSNLDVRLSDEVKKFINNFKGVELLYFASENKTYTREEFINSFKQSFNKDIKLPKFLYHGTNSSNIIGILTKGLAPTPLLTNFKKISHEKHVFMSSSLETAKEYSNMAVMSKKINVKRIVLKIDSDKIDKNKITFDFDFYNMNVGKGNDHYDEMLKNNMAGFNHKHQDLANKNPGAMFNKLGYNGIVYPGAFVSVFVEEEYNNYVEMSIQDYLAKYVNPVENKTQKSSSKVIITEEQLMALIEAETPNTMTFWHGGNLDNPDNDLSQKAGRFEYGPGLYLITKYDVAIKYAKGSRKLYKVEVETGNDLEYTGINADNVKEFIKTYVLGNKKNFIWNEMMKRVDENNLIPGYVVNNVIINENAIKPGNTKYLRQFYVNNGIDYNIVKNPFGWGEKMLVLFNMKKIKNITKIGPKDQIDKYDLHEDVTNVIYSAIFFDKNELVSKYKPVYPNVFAHHSTIEFRPKDISNLPIGENIEVRIKGRLITENVDVLLIDNEFSKNDYPHITLSTNIDIVPFQSSEEIKNNLDKIKPLNDLIIGKVGYFDGHDKFI